MLDVAQEVDAVFVLRWNGFINSRVFPAFAAGYYKVEFRMDGGEMGESFEDRFEVFAGAQSANAQEEFFREVEGTGNGGFEFF